MKNENTKVGIFTTFYKFVPEYSLTTVVKYQLESLLKYGYKPVLFVLTNFEDDDKIPAGVELKKIIPQLTLEPYGKDDLTTIEEDSNKVKEVLLKEMADIDVCLAHDIIFINTYLPYNVGLNKAINEGLKTKFLHWIHSGPSARPSMTDTLVDLRYTLPPQSKLVYMNNTDVIRIAEMYAILPKDVRVIPNPTDIRELNEFHPLSRELCDKYDILSADFICTYPLSSTRMGEDGKQLNKVLKVMGKLKKRGNTVRVIIPNAHANADKEKETIERMYFLGMQYGLSRDEIIFTSLIGKEWETGVPHKVVRDMFSLTNIFIFPSVSENCPLILMEAMAYKCLLVLNKSFPAMQDFALENALYFNFGSLINQHSFPCGEDRYYEDVATLILSEFNQNSALKANQYFRQHFNSDYIFKQKLEPAIKEIMYE